MNGFGNGFRAACRSGVLGLIGVLGLSFGLSAFAEEGADTRALRLSTAEGQVQVVQDGQVIADPANANLPLFEGSQIITGNDGRAEIQLEDGGVARLSPNTTLTFTVLQQDGSNTRTEMVLNSGLAYFEMQPSTPEHIVRVSYGTATLSASSFAVVRLNLDTPPGSMAVFSGDVHVERGRSQQLDIHGGESLSFDLNDASRYTLSESIATDSWDSWNADQDQALNKQDSEKTVADSYINNQPAGMSDLDANGNWYNVPGQGLVWSPYIAMNMGAGWDPYGYGRWVYYPRYGYIWSSGYNWGYAPYQCGTWNYFDSFGWGWAPGYGCNPWYYGGGWGYNIGSYPRGYHPPRRPDTGPIRPRGGPHPVGNGSDIGSRRVAVAPVPVDRRGPSSVGTGPVTPVRGGSVQPVTINGRQLQPLRPVAPRQTYSGSPASIAIRGGAQPGVGYNPRANSGYNPRATYGTTPGQNPAGNSGAGQQGFRPAPQQPIYRPQPSGGGGNSPRPAPSFGGGGGGSAPRPSGGGGGGSMGGGGGGGGSHPSSGSPHK